MARLIYEIIDWLLLFIIAFVFAIRTSPVQTALAEYATSYLSKELNTTLSIEKLDIVFVDRIDLKGVLLLNQQQNDTIASFGSILVNVEGVSAFRKQIHLNSVLIENGVFKLVREVKTEMLNLRFLIDYFSSNKEKKKGHIPITIDKAHLKNIRFMFDNDMTERRTEGMDYQHLSLSEIELKARNVKIRNGIITANVDGVSAKEKCGFQLDKFTASYLIVSDHGVELKDVTIKTPYSDIKSEDFRMLYSRYPQFRTFIDSVAFDVKLNHSVTSFKDIAFFAPQLKGMDQRVEIEAKVTKFVKDLKVEDFIFKMGNKSVVRGTVNLPDFRDTKNAVYQEQIDYAYIDLHDLQTLNLPIRSGRKNITLNENVRRFDHFEAYNAKFNGVYSRFVLSADNINTAIGSVNISKGILFTHNPQSKSFLFTHAEANEYDVKVNEFNLGRFLDNPTFGMIDGTFSLSGEAFSFTDIKFNDMNGDVNRFDMSDYTYSNITIKNASLIDKVLFAEADVEDKNLLLNYRGTVDFSKELKLDMIATIDKAFLDKLKIRDKEGANFTATVNLNTFGVNPNTLSGIVALTNVIYVEGDKKIEIPSLDVTINRAREMDFLTIRSSIVDADLEGKMNFNNVNYIVKDQLRQLFPALFAIGPKKKEKQLKLDTDDCLTFNINVKDANPILDIFQPKLNIAKGTVIEGDYDVGLRYFIAHINSSEVTYDKIVAKGIRLHQNAQGNKITADYNIVSLKLNDSITLENLKFETEGNGENLISILTWNPETENYTSIKWSTQIESKNKYNFIFEPSFFSINQQRWNIAKAANVRIDSTSISVDKFKLTSGEQFISINGTVSKNDNDQLKFELNEVDLYKLGLMIGLNKSLAGKLNGWGFISNPYKNLTYMGDLKILGLAINNEEVGDVYAITQWDTKKNKVDLSGDLIYRGMPTFEFQGTYDISKKKDNLDFNLVFDQTNISFVNAFFEPLVIGDVKGYVNGKLDITGSISRPIIEGTVRLDNASAKIVLLGTTYNLSGPVHADKDGFYIDYMPIADVEGNTGSLTGSIYHTDYKDWNFDLAIDVEEDYYKRDPNKNWVKVPLQRFLVMNTDGRDGALYYGKAYATGTVGIFGYLKNLDINVDLKSQKGTWVDLSLFRQREIQEDNFIEFVSQDTTKIKQEKRIDFSGVTLNLNMEATPDAQLKLIFNEQTEDEITAYGYGKISLKMDNLGQLSLDGNYSTVEGSKYDFVLGPIKETFYIAEGGSINWTGNPYDATLNLNAYYRLRANLGDLSPELLVSGTQEINCYLKLSESLMKPTIDFDIKAPKAPDGDKTLLAQLTSEQDELNRQFFSLLLWKKFQPTKGSTRASGGAALDLATNQINSMLSQVSQDYKLNVDMNTDSEGRSEYALGIEKGFLDDQLVVSGSFGARNDTKGNQSQSTVIGDLEIEYKLNKEGSFRINVFNESNDNRYLQSNNERGLFKQGIGIYYRENFNSFRDFRLLQKFYDIFRKKENKRYPISRKKQQTPVPTKEEELNRSQQGTK